MTPTFLLITISALFLTTAGVPSTVPSPQDCVADLVAFSPCFGYVSAPPNNVMDGVNPQCCKAVTEAFGSGNGSNCFCHLVNQPLLFGFPLNRTKIASLPSLCSKRISNSTSLATICAALPPPSPPPPPSSPTSVGEPTSSDSGSDDYTSPDQKDPPTEPVPTVSGADNRTTLPPPELPAESGEPSPVSSSTGNPPVADTQVSSAPASSMAAQLGGAAFQLLLSLV
ncbi:Non-specific lipid transfer protein GPI-anchored 25 [Linum grandiflorum]